MRFANDLDDNSFTYYDELLRNDPFQTDPHLEADGLAYRDEVVTRLQGVIEEYLEFATTRDLIKLVAGLL